MKRFAILGVSLEKNDSGYELKTYTDENTNGLWAFYDEAAAELANARKWAKAWKLYIKKRASRFRIITPHGQFWLSTYEDLEKNFNRLDNEINRLTAENARLKERVKELEDCQSCDGCECRASEPPHGCMLCGPCVRVTGNRRDYDHYKKMSRS